MRAPGWPRPIRTAMAMVLLALAPTHAGGSEAPSGPGRAQIVYGDGRPREEVAILESGSQVFFSARDLSAIIGAPRYWRSDLKRLTIKSGTHEMVLVVDSDVAILDANSPLHLPATVQQRGDAVWIPIEILLDADQVSGGLNGLDGASPWFDLPIRWDSAAHRLEVGEPAGRLTAVVLSSTSSEHLDLHFDGTWEWRLAQADRERVVLRLIGIEGLPQSASMPAGNELYRDLRTTLIPDGVEVTFAVAENVLGYRLQRLEHPGRLAVTLSVDPADLAYGRITPFAPRIAEMPMGGHENPMGTGTETIVIDPAGGGERRGIHAKGVVESEAMLELARDLAHRLTEELGVVVILTRDADRSLSDEERVAMANSAGASLFISLHYDAHPSPSVAGPRAVVARNRSGPRAGVPGAIADLGFAAWDEGQRDVWPRAYQLADRLVTELSQSLNVPSRGVEEWPLPILSAATMPAVYLEVATLTAPGGENRLSGRQDAVINAIVRAINRYRTENR